MLLNNLGGGMRRSMSALEDTVDMLTAYTC